MFRQGDSASAIFVVETGRIRLARVLAHGVSLVVHIAQAGETFAEASLSAARYHCDAIAEDHSTVLAVPKADLLAALSNDPSQALAVAKALASQVRDLRARLELRNVRPATERVLTWLRLHASGDPPRVPQTRPWTQVADELGLTREALYRALAKLEQQKMIGRDDKVVRLITAPAPTQPLP